MTLKEIVDAAEGLAEVPRLEWLAMLKTIRGVTNELHSLWLSDLIAGAENANGALLVAIEKSKAAKMCELAGE
jgi:hypothetical protein